MASQSQAALLSEAISKVHSIKSSVNTALHLCPDVPDLGQAAADSTLDCLERAQQQIQQLQQLAPQLRQLAAAVPQQQSAEAPGQPGVLQQQQQQQPAAGWISEAQQQAAQASQALLKQVQAAVCAPHGAAGGGLQPPRQQLQQRQYFDQGHQPLLQLMQRVEAVVPWLQLCLFKSSTNHMYWPPTAEKRALKLNRDTEVAKNAARIDEIRVVCPGVFAASIALAAPGCLNPVRVCVDGVDKASSINAWTSSKHQVFKQISNLSVRALQHFHRLEQAYNMLEAPDLLQAAPAAAGAASGTSSNSKKQQPGIALECLLLWLASYEDLFSRPCDVSGKLITWEPATAIPLPPVLRPYWLPLEQLRESARDRAQRKAYHTHLAPWPAAEKQAASVTTAVHQQQDTSTHTAAVTQLETMQQRPQVPHSSWVGVAGFDGIDGVPAVTDEQLAAYLQDIMAH